jgi:hypothetical protein
MRSIVWSGLAALLAGGVGAGEVVAQDAASSCKAVHADLTEDRSTTGCRPGHPVCFVGVVDGNHGLRGTTYFRGQSSTDPIPTSPEFRGYSGTFEYATERGTLTALESGVTSATQGVVTAHQKIIGATGEYAGATGYLFVSGFTDGRHVVTRVTGEICYP